MNPTELTRQASFIERFAAHAGQLTRSELRVAQYIRRHPERAVVASAAALGRMTSTSDATVLRTVKALGYRGLREMHASLVDQLRRRQDLTTQLAARVEAVTPATTSVFEQVQQDSIATLRELPARLPDDRWRECVQAVDAAAGILCFGLGPAGTIAEHLAIGLTRLGMAAVATVDSGIRLADRLAALAPGWALVVFAPLRMFREIGVALDRARDVGATSIVITEALAREVRNRADIVLTTPPSAEGAASETLAPLVLTQALTMEIAALRSEQAAQNALLLERLRAGITGTTTAR